MCFHCGVILRVIDLVWRGTAVFVLSFFWISRMWVDLYGLNYLQFLICIPKISLCIPKILVAKLLLSMDHSFQNILLLLLFNLICSQVFVFKVNEYLWSILLNIQAFKRIIVNIWLNVKIHLGTFYSVLHFFFLCY